MRYTVVMINLACLDPQYFRAVLDGHKNTEYRRRKRIDSRLNAVRVGEPLLLFERLSRRVLVCQVTRVERHRSRGQWLYAIGLSRRRSLRYSDAPHLQGWHRRAVSPI